MTIQELQDQLRGHIRSRIGRGELTGSGWRTPRRSRRAISRIS